MPCPSRPSLSRKTVGQHLTCENTSTVPLSHRFCVPQAAPQASDLRFCRLSHCPPLRGGGTPGHHPATRTVGTPVVTTHPMKGTPMNTPQEDQAEGRVNRSAMAAARQAGVLAEDHGKSAGDAANVPADQGAREARYAEAIEDGLFRMHGLTSSCDHHEEARGVMAVADAEVAAAVSEAQAEVAGMKGARNAARRRAESAEAEVERVREGIRALADEWEDLARRATANAKKHPIVAGQYADEAENWTYFKDALRALLAPPPAATTREARGRTLGCMWCDEDSCDHGALQVPAPVSSGEAGTGEDERWGPIVGWCPHYAPDGECEVKGCPATRPAPVVTPSAEDGA